MRKNRVYSTSYLLLTNPDPPSSRNISTTAACHPQEEILWRNSGRVVLEEAIVVAKYCTKYETRKWEAYPYAIRKCGIFIIKFLVGT